MQTEFCLGSTSEQVNFEGRGDSVEWQGLSLTPFIFQVISNYHLISWLLPIPVAVRSKAWVFGRSLTRIVGSNPTGGMDVCLL